jgi:hypothetical protein
MVACYNGNDGTFVPSWGGQKKGDYVVREEKTNIIVLKKICTMKHTSYNMRNQWVYVIRTRLIAAGVSMSEQREL